MRFPDKTAACQVAASGIQKLFLLFLTSAMLAFSPSVARAQGFGIGGFDFASPVDLTIAFDYDGTGKADHLLVYRPGTGTVWIIGNQNGAFSSVFSSDQGIGGFDLRGPNDRILALDYSGSGHMDHLVCYRPGAGVVWILANNGGVFSSVYQSNSGIGGYDLRSPNDQILAFDALGTGTQKDLVVYRPGAGTVWVLQNSGGSFAAILQSNAGIGSLDLLSTSDRIVAFDLASNEQVRTLVAYRPGYGVAQAANVVRSGAAYSFNGLYFSSINSSTGKGNGIGGYDLLSPNDQLTPFDFAGTGHLDHLVAYRPGSGVVWALHYTADPFLSADYQGTGAGLGGFDLLSPSDRLIAFDYLRTGQQDHLFAYRPGTGVVFVLANTSGTFSAVFQSLPQLLPPTGNGIGGYDLRSPGDLAFAYDYDGSHKADHLVLYRPGTGTIWILAHTNGTFQPVFSSSNGIGGFDLRNQYDRVFALDYAHSGSSNYLVCYRPGTGVVWILQNNHGTFTPVFQSSSGIGGYDLRSTADKMMAVNIGSGLNMDLLLYRPGAGTVWALQSAPLGGFVAQYRSNNGLGSINLMSSTDEISTTNATGVSTLLTYRPGSGAVEEGVIGEGDTGFGYQSQYSSTTGYNGYNFRSPNDKLTSLDWLHSGLPSHLVLYRAGSGIAWVTYPVVLLPPVFETPVNSAGIGTGLGGYDLRSSTDVMFPFDFDSSGKPDHLVAYRPGTGIIWILAHVNGGFAPVFQSSASQ